MKLFTYATFGSSHTGLSVRKGITETGWKTRCKTHARSETLALTTTGVVARVPALAVRVAQVHVPAIERAVHRALGEGEGVAAELKARRAEEGDVVGRLPMQDHQRRREDAVHVLPPVARWNNSANRCVSDDATQRQDLGLQAGGFTPGAHVHVAR